MPRQGTIAVTRRNLLPIQKIAFNQQTKRTSHQDTVNNNSIAMMQEQLKTPTS